MGLVTGHPFISNDVDDDGVVDDDVVDDDVNDDARGLVPVHPFYIQ